MDRGQGERWHCMNAACRKERVIELMEVRAASNPRCDCGAEMKKAYSAPVFRYLEFLRLDEPVLAERAPRKE
jgi:hypothetical protein